MDLLIKLFDVLFPVFLIIGIGYWYGKKDPKFDTKCIQQIREIRAIKWMTYNQVLKHINQYNSERIEIFKNIHLNISN